MKSFLFALQFLTIIPVRIQHINEKITSRSLVYFPLVGLVLGLILAGIDNLLLYFNLEQLSINIVLVVSLIILTGGLHLDGLSDSCDALLSRKDREEMLKIMRDSHIGVMGVLAIISILLLKIAFLFSLNLNTKVSALLLMCILSRWSLVLAMFIFNYARLEGKAKAFFAGMNLKVFILSTAIALATAVVFGQIRGLFIMAIVAAATYVMARFIKSKLGGITGDTLGATNEIMEVIILLTICLLKRSGL